jgi:hypothetical protein
VNTISDVLSMAVGIVRFAIARRGGRGFPVGHGLFQKTSFEHGWGASARFEGQRVGRDHPVEDKTWSRSCADAGPSRSAAATESGYCCCRTDRMFPAGSLNQATTSPFLRMMPLASCPPSGMS